MATCAAIDCDAAARPRSAARGRNPIYCEEHSGDPRETLAPDTSDDRSAESPEAPKETRPSGPRRRFLAPQRPKRRQRRASTAPLWHGIWGGGGSALGSSERWLPVSRVLLMQADMAGPILDDLVKNTMVDRLLQPLARQGAQATAISALVGPPLLIALLSQHPELEPALRPVLVPLLRSMLTEMVRGAAQVQAQEAKLTAALADAGMDLGPDPVGMLLAQIFATPADAPSANGAGPP